MNKQELVARVQYYMGPGTAKSTASAAVEAVLSSVLAASLQEKVHIAGFGTFERLQRAARRGYDINTGNLVDIPARSVVSFRPASGFPARKPPQS